mmetsp:Transcript_20736/g.52871  ORF Transcript_20736/g.52871 Transcript_20736/m.52871 type:complete len:189 (+) Transcript_20736:2961-3527(+)
MSIHYSSTGVGGLSPDNLVDRSHCKTVKARLPSCDFSVSCKLHMVTPLHGDTMVTPLRRPAVRVDDESRAEHLTTHGVCLQLMLLARPVRSGPSCPEATRQLPPGLMLSAQKRQCPSEGRCYRRAHGVEDAKHQHVMSSGQSAETSSMSSTSLSSPGTQNSSKANTSSEPLAAAASSSSAFRAAPASP